MTRNHLRYLLRRGLYLWSVRALSSARQRILSRAGLAGEGYQRLVVYDPGYRQRLKSYLCEVFPDQPKEVFARAIENGQIRVNLRRASQDTRVRHKDLIELWIESVPRFQLVPLPEPLEVVYLDRDIVVFVKPAGVLSHPSRYTMAWPSVAGSLISQGLVPEGVGSQFVSGLAHRLDRPTSGLLVAGRNRKALARLKRLFRERRVHKEYVAVVAGTVERGGVVDRPIARDYERFWAFKVADEGRHALTVFDVREKLPGATVLSVRIHTGRTHQIRVHLASLGHPLVGDKTYAGPCPEGLSGLLLHAERLAFPHPVTGRPLDFRAQPGPEFQRNLALLREGALLAS